MKRIIDANINRSTEALRALEELARFYLDDRGLCEELKLIRHDIHNFFEPDYEALIKSRNTEEDIGKDIVNPDKRSGVETVFKANIKRLQEALRVLSEYGNLDEKYRYRAYELEKVIYGRLKMNLKKYLLENKKLYLVTNSDQFENDQKFLDAIASSLMGGVDIVQLREKKADAKRTIELGKMVRQLCSQFNALFIINDRVDIAKIVEADGVHLGQDDIGILEAREILGTSAIIGKSTHAPEQALAAVEEGADYIGCGPVFITPTKQGREAVGLEYISWAKKNIEIPLYAIGGIDLSNIHKVKDAGATRAAVVRAIINSDNPKFSANEFKRILAD